MNKKIVKVKRRLIMNRYAKFSYINPSSRGWVLKKQFEEEELTLADSAVKTMQLQSKPENIVLV